MSKDINIPKDKANYSWKCPYCDKQGFTEWNKSCYYQIIEHCQEEHLEQSFDDLIKILKKQSPEFKKNMLNSQWNVFSGHIRRINKTEPNGDK